MKLFFFPIPYYFFLLLDGVAESTVLTFKWWRTLNHTILNTSHPLIHSFSTFQPKWGLVLTPYLLHIHTHHTPRDFFFCVTWPCSFTTLRHVNRNSCIIIIIIIEAEGDIVLRESGELESGWIITSTVWPRNTCNCCNTWRHSLIAFIKCTWKPTMSEDVVINLFSQRSSR